MGRASFIIKTEDCMMETGDKTKWMAEGLFITNQGQ